MPDLCFAWNLLVERMLARKKGEKKRYSPYQFNFLIIKNGTGISDSLIWEKKNFLSALLFSR